MSALTVRDLHVHLQGEAGPIHIVRGLGFTLEAGRITGLAGESGCGKSITALALMGLLPATTARVKARSMSLGDVPLLEQDRREWQALRGRRLAMIFQDPGTALDPVFTIGSQLRAVASRQPAGAAVAPQMVLQALADTGFSDPADIAGAYPHQLSGGMRQLVMIAMARLTRPAVLLADEPTTALDVTTQAQVLRQLQQLAAEHGTAILLISHDLRVLAEVAQQVLVMYCGRLVEVADSGPLFSQPRHPYTAGLLAALPAPGKAARPIPGRVPAAGEALSACAFAPRCPQATARCRQVSPELSIHAGHRVACHHPL